VAKLTNTGNSTLTISAAPALSGTNAASFQKSTTCGTTLAVGANCTITIVFAPAVTGSLSAALTIKDNASTQTQMIAITGTAVAAAKATLTPASPLMFAAQTVATASAAKVLTLANTGGVSMSVTSYTISGTNATDFTQTHTCGTAVAAGASCSISVTFKPAASGTRTATLTVVTTGGTVAETLTGTAAAAAVKAKVTLSSGKNPVAPGETVTLRSSVANAVGGAAAPTGTVRLMDGGHLLTETKLAKGGASFKVNSLASGFHSLTAEYMGDEHHSGATSGVVLQRVAGQVEPPKKVALP
jgi:trimeric autotransporter adhesin